MPNWNIGLTRAVKLALAGLAVVTIAGVLTLQSGASIKMENAAADADGNDLAINGSDGGAHTSNDPDGGDIVLTPGAAGSGGSGADGKLIVRQPGGTPGTDEGSLYHNGDDLIIDCTDGGVILSEGGTARFYATGSTMTAVGSIIPGSTGVRSLGSAAKTYLAFYGRTLSSDQGQALTLTSAASAADTTGVDININAPAGGADGGANPDGGNVIVTPGALGSGGSGSDGRLIVRQPGGTPGTDELQLYDDGSQCNIKWMQTQLNFRDSANNIIMALAGTCTIQTHILPDGNNNRDIGSTSRAYNEIFVRNLLTENPAADTDGADLTITGQDGGAHTSNDPDGGDIVLTPGAAGSGGSGEAGHIVINSIKNTTGDPTGVEGAIYVNTFDNAIKVYADGAWRTLASW